MITILSFFRKPASRIWMTVTQNIHPLDVTLALAGLFLFLALHHRLTTKGPMIWPVLGYIPNLLLHYHDLHNWNTKSLFDTAGGTTFRFRSALMGRRHAIITADPSKVEHMLKTNFPNYPKGELYRERFRELLGDGIFNADGDAWREQRRVASAEMHTRRFAEYAVETVRGLVHNKLLKLMMRKHQEAAGCGSGGVVDLQEWLLRFTFDNVCRVALGIDPGCLDDPDLPEIPFARAFEEATEYSLRRFLIPSFVWKGMKRFDVGSERKLKRAVRVVHEFVDEVVRNRKAGYQSNSGRRCDLLSRLIEIQVQRTNDIMHQETTTTQLPLLQGNKRSSSSVLFFSDELLRDFCTSFILAGRDTSSVALTWFFWLINNNPRVEQKILEEIKGILRNRRRRRSHLLPVAEEEEEEDNDVVFEAEELEKMVYLHASLSESMRLYPPVPIDFKQVLEDDTYPDGTPAEKGDRVYYHIYAMGRLRSVWGDDCDEFKPERWIRDYDDGNREGGCHRRVLAVASPFEYAVFNAGPRLCVGKKFAYAQMKLVAASVLLRFRVKVVEDQVVAPKITTTLYMKNGLLVTFHPRREDRSN